VGPVYDIDQAHHYQEIVKHAEKLRQMQGPVYFMPDRQHNFDEMPEMKKKEGELKVIIDSFNINNYLS